MAGKQLERTMVAEIAKRGGTEYVLDRVASGETLTRIAESLGVSRPLLNNWLLHGDRKEQYTYAKQLAAGALVDQSLDIVDQADVASVQLAKLKADTRRWIAGKLDRDQWGEQSGPTVAIQINNLHSGSLRNRGE